MDQDNNVDPGQLPANTNRKTFGEVLSVKCRKILRKFTTKRGLIGTYDYKYMFTPNLPFINKKAQTSPFFGVNDEMPLLLGFLLGLSHTLAVLIGVATPPLLMAQTANLDNQRTTYMVSCSLIVSGFLSFMQISRRRIFKTRYYIGTGLLSIVGTSFSTITIATTGIPQMYKSGFCPTDSDGKQLPCPQAYEAILGASAVCAILEILASFIPAKALQKMFPPLVTGPVVVLIGVKLIGSGMKDWAGGSNDCMDHPSKGFFALCPNIDAPHPLPWGAAEAIGLGFSVFVSIVLCERFGAPIMKSSSVIIGLLVGCIIAAACGYFESESIDEAPVITFMWTDAFTYRIYGPIVLPMLAVYVTIIMEGIGTITATCDVSRQEVTGPVYETRIQGGLLADGFNGILSALANNAPVSTFAQNNGVIAMTKCANRGAGYWGCIILIICGIFAKFSAAIVAIPKPVLGGLTTFLFTSVLVSGLRVVSIVEFTGRNRFILTCSCMFGFSASLVPDWFSYVFTYEGDNTGLKGFLDAIELVCQTGFAMAGFVGVIMNLILPNEAFEILQADDVSEHSVRQVELEPKKATENENNDINVHGENEHEHDNYFENSNARR